MQLAEGLLRVPDSQLKRVLSDKTVLDALHALLRRCLNDDSIIVSSSSGNTTTPPADRDTLAKLFHRLSRQPGCLPLSTLILFVSLFQSTNRSFVQSCVSTALEHDDDLFASAAEYGPEALTNSFDPSIGKVTLFERRAVPLMALARSCPTLASVFGQSTVVVKALAQWYEYETFRENLDWRLQILSTFAQVVDAAYIAPLANSSAADRQTLVQEMIDALSTVWKSSIIQEWSYYFRPVNSLDQYRECDQLIKKLPDSSAPLTDDWVQRLHRRKSKRPSVSQPARRASEVSPIMSTRDVTNPEEDLLVSQLLEVLPDESPDFLRACVRHPTFSGSSDDNAKSEAILALILEDNLPPDLASQRHQSHSVATSTVSASPEMVARRNVFEDEPLDVNRIYIPSHAKSKQPNRLLPSLLDDTAIDDAIDDSIKAAIIARAEAPSSDESDSDDDHVNAREVVDDAYGSDDDDNGLPTRRGPVNTPRHANKVARVKHDDESTDEDQPHDKSASSDATTAAAGHNHSSRPATPASTTTTTTMSTKQVEEILLSHYLASTAVFDRSANVRRSTERRKLREQTGWTDEQIEGWRIMFERNPDKDKIVDKQKYAKPINVSLPSPANRLERPPTDAVALASSSAGSNGARRGGKSSNRKAHDRRVRGRDRKLAHVA